MFREGFADQTDRASVDRIGECSVSTAANRILQPATFTQLPHELAAIRVNVGPVFIAKVSTGPSFQFRHQRFVTWFEERPVEMRGGSHPSVSVELGILLVDKGLIGTVKIVGGHANPLRSASSPLMLRPVKRSSAARP